MLKLKLLSFKNTSLIIRRVVARLVVRQTVVGLVLFSSLSFLTLSFISCSKQEFVRQQYTANGSEIGFRYIPAKVDLVLVPDNTASIGYAFNTLTSRFNSFISTLRGQYWDYHVMRSLLFNPDPISNALVNPDYNSATYPDGTPNPNTDLVPGSVAITNPADFPIIRRSDVVGNVTIDNTMEELIPNIQAARNTPNHFVREDALLAIVIITNGADKNLIENESDARSKPSLTKVQTAASEIKSLKNNSALVRFYPIVSYNYYIGGQCYGDNAFIGSGYTKLLDYLRGLSADFCDANALNQVLAAIAEDLRIVRQSYIFSNIILEHEPIEESIEVSRNGEKIPHDTAHGWTYEGFKTVYAVTGILDPSGTIQPFFSNRRTGFVIALHGDAQMKGSDSPNIQYERK